MSVESGKAFRKRYPWHDLYRSAKRRCEDCSVRSYRYCGARGIKFQLTMFDVFILFLRDGGHQMVIPSLDRKNSKDNYHYDNCRIIEKSINERLPHDLKLAAEWTD